MTIRTVPTGNALFLILALSAVSPQVEAQSPPPPRLVAHEVFAGGELEEYLRSLQVAGKTPAYPMAIRGWSSREVSQIGPASADHPWTERYRFAPESDDPPGLAVVPPSLDLQHNSAFPDGHNDGALWAGRGLTAAVRAGVAASWGSVSLVVAPMLFVAENREFETTTSPETGESFRFADPIDPYAIDLPQRFGEGVYTRFDLGQSVLRFDGSRFSAGLSSAHEFWGPASVNPMILGDNAPGFVHLFAGTSQPIDLRAASLHLRAIWGRLEQSEYATTPPDSARRFGTGLVAVITPAVLPGLELGGARFFHMPWVPGTLDSGNYLRIFSAFYKENTSDPRDEDPVVKAENQIASLFFRWVAPRGGFETYGEYAREDASWNARDFVLEPDHHGGYMLGGRKVWAFGGTGMVSLQGEVVNTQISELYRVRTQSPFYRHTMTRQGHTHRGQLLGSPFGYGGGGQTVRLDAYSGRGRHSAVWSRALRNQQPRTTAPTAVRDVSHRIGLETVRFLGRLEWRVGVAGTYEQNRYLSADAYNATLSAGVSFVP